MNSLKETLERHFSTVLSEFEEDLPSVQVEDSKNDDDEEEETYRNSTNWTCIYCRSKNAISNPLCTECGSPSPKLNEKKKGKK